MANRKRIVLNTAVTYIRTIFAAIVAIFTARWVLQALGADDYGLYGLVGSILIFVTFLNNVLAGAVARYLAYSIGKNNVEELNRWFHASIIIHILIPAVLVILGICIGTIAILYYLNITQETRGIACSVFYISLIAAAVPMVLAPFKGLLMAKQDIRIQSTIEIFQSIAHLILVYVLTKLTSPNLLIIYAWFMAGETVVFNLISAITAKRLYKDIKFHLYPAKIIWPYTKEILLFSTWKSLVGFGTICYNQGQSVVLNLFFGTRMNASYSIASNLSAQSSSISTSMMMAVTPEITSREGAGNREAMQSLSNKASKYSVWLIALIAVPLFMQVDDLLKVWLVDPPAYTSTLCRYILAAILVERIAIGHESALNAYGKIKHFQIAIGISLICGVFLTYLMLLLYKSPAMIGVAMIITQLSATIIRVYYGKKIVDMSVGLWFKEVVWPNTVTISLVMVLTYAIFYYSNLGAWSSLICVSLMTSLWFFVFGWIFIFDKPIKEHILKRLPWHFFKK